MSENVIVIQTASFNACVNSATGILTLAERSSGRVWSGDPWQNTAGVLDVRQGKGTQQRCLLSRARNIRVNREGQSAIAIHFDQLVSDNGAEIGGSVRTRISIADAQGAIRVAVLSLDLPEGWEMVELEYPCRLGALVTDVDDGYMVVPFFSGGLVPSTVSKWKEIPKVATWSWDDGPWTEQGGGDYRIAGWMSMSLPLYGVVDGQSALLGLIETENDASLRVVLNSNNQFLYSRKGELSPFSRLDVTSPLWLAERNQLGYARSMIFVSLPNGDYNTMIQRYRQLAQEQKLLVPLREKLERTPHLDKAIGSHWITVEGGYPYYIDWPAFRYTWKDAKKLVDDLKDYVGFKRVMLSLWIGYSQLPPDSYPFHPAQGPLEDLQDLVEYALSRDVLIHFYHGYPALLDDAPNGDIAFARRDRDGKMIQRWGRHCPACQLDHIKKNLPYAVRDSGIVCEYSDIFTSCALSECWDERHPLTRTQDRAARVEMMQYIQSLGIFTGSEWPVHYAIPHMDYYRFGSASAGGHMIMSQIRAPLWQMAFKDCAVMYSFLDRPGENGLRDIAAGCHTQSSCPSIKDYYYDGRGPKTRSGLRDNAAIFQDWMRQTGKEALVSHQWVEEFNGPYINRFSDGSEALANLTYETREVDGVVMQPQSLILRPANGKMLTVAPQDGWSIIK